MGLYPEVSRKGYQRWDSNQTKLLKKSFAEGKNLREMTKIINDYIKNTRPGAVKTMRTSDSVAYKLKNLNLISEEKMKNMLKVKKISVAFNRLNNYEEIRESVLSRDKKTCVICGKKNHLHLAHIVPFRETFQKRPTELITLCINCHKIFDKYNEFETEKVFNYMCKTYPDFKDKYKITRRYNPITNKDLCEIKRTTESSQPS